MKMRSACKRCGKEFGWHKATVVFWISQEVYSFCSAKCRVDFLDLRLSKRVCAREICNNRVPEGNKMLCLHCYQNGDHLGEPNIGFDETDRAHLERAEKALLERIEGKVQIFSAKNMTQKELSSLVPSLHGGAE